MMGMPITVEVADPAATEALLDEVFAYFGYVDETFSVYKETSEISRINRGEISLMQASADMQAIFALADRTRRQSGGYFDIMHDGAYDPSGVVKGWAIARAAALIEQQGFKNFYVDAGGDIQASGQSSRGQSWRVGIRNPFDVNEIVKVLALGDGAVATSGTSIRGQHIYNPYDAGRPITDIVSLTVIGHGICDADRFATAAFAMSRAGIAFIEQLAGFEGYMIDRYGRATFTSGFTRYIAS
jgi:thiamine biosynthesis lipoprotein